MAFTYELEFVRKRYNRLAVIYPLFEFVFLLPLGLREHAVGKLGLRTGDSVLEVGCGTGRNLRLLVEAVGVEGKVYAVDYCPGMLERARKLCEQAGWRNVELVLQDAAALQLPEPVDAVLFSLSYSVMPRPREALAQAWRYLRLGGRAVIMDGKLARGMWGRVSSRFVTWLSKRTILGDPERLPWKDFAALTTAIKIDEVNLGTYYVCTATKRR